MATGTMEDYGVPVQTTRLSLSSMKLLCFEMFPDGLLFSNMGDLDCLAVFLSSGVFWVFSPASYNKMVYLKVDNECAK